TLTREEADQVLDGLSPVKYNYKTDKENRHVGFVAEDVPDLVATKERKALSPMDIVAVLTKVVQEQKSAMAEQTNRLSEQKNRIAEQTNMISELARRLDAMQQEINRVKGMNMVGSIDANIK
ncbi:MAG: tail fiber domain-containing protein, partial [Dissulfurispiraceae bacterium]